jgi:hypothetical protein
MSYTFLPSNEHEKMKREYRARVLIVLLFFAAMSIIVGVVSLFPSYIYATLEEQFHLRQVAMIQKGVDAHAVTAIQRELSGNSALVNALSSNIEPDIFSTAIAEVSSVRGDVSIDSIAVERPSDSSATIVVSGIAPQRADLLAFEARLEDMSPKTTVNLPVSVLAQDSNVSFSLQIQQSLP